MLKYNKIKIANRKGFYRCFSSSKSIKKRRIKMNLLFICKYNRFRSKVAEAYFKKINKNRDIKSSGAGLIKGSPVNPRVIKIAKKFKINISGKPRGLSSELIKKQDLIINTADDVPSSIFRPYSKKIINWKIPDVTKINEKQVSDRIEKIIKKTEELNKILEKKK
jgi:protein-tyrosine-phosphatase